MLQHNLPPLFLLLALSAAVPGQEVERLPPVGPDSGFPGELTYFPEERTEFGRFGPQTSFPPMGEPLPPPPADDAGPPGARPGVFQKAVLQTTWLARGTGAEDVGVTDVEVWTVFGFPCPTRKSPMVVTPGFAVHSFDGPTASDLPSQVYDAYTEFRWFSQPTRRLGVDLAVTPGWFSDFHENSSEALRITGHGAGIYTWNDRAKIIAGAAYLDRSDVPVLPIGGLVWTPNEDVSFELVSPRPRVARRVYWAGSPDPETQDWLYVAGELGGGTWAIRRADGRGDLLTSRDYRVILGLERKVTGRLSALFEAGYVFGRRFEYDSATPDIRPSDTILLRARLTY